MTRHPLRPVFPSKSTGLTVLQRVPDVWTIGYYDSNGIWRDLSPGYSGSFEDAVAWVTEHETGTS